jgi:hypothetical protein
MSPAKPKQRCSWAQNDPVYLAYHDEEWGVPERDSRALWETLMLEGFQAGLSWITILRKREAFRKAFKNFDPRKVARFTETDIARLLEDAGISKPRSMGRGSIWRWRQPEKTSRRTRGCSLAENRSRIPVRFRPVHRWQRMFQKI